MTKLLTRMRRPLRPALRLLLSPFNAARLNVLDRVSNPAAATLVRAIRKHQSNFMDEGCEMIAQIELERRRLSSCADPLSDGTLPEAFDGEREISVAQACRASRPPRAARLLYLLIREFGPSSVLEIGTNVGISGAYIAAALIQNGTQGKLVTLEGSAYRQRLARQLFERLSLGNTHFIQGMFQDTLEPALKEHGPFDFAFIDGHHQYEPTLRYMELIWKYSQDNAVFLFDDIRWSSGMRKAWEQIKSDQRVTAALDLNNMGVCIMCKEPKASPIVAGPLYFQ